MDKGYESAEICKDCGGACCRANGCSLAPEDMLRELEAWRTEGKIAVGQIGRRMTANATKWIRGKWRNGCGRVTAL